MSAKMTIAAESLLLDTHVWIWLAPSARNASPGPFSSDCSPPPAPARCIFDLSIWELSLLDAKRRIRSHHSAR
jgi:PIN domain nuclease of toxin-antitoxin system